MDFSIITIFLGGIATVFTPCILPVLPVYIGVFANSASNSNNKKFSIFTQTLSFGLGFSILFIIMGLGVSTISSFVVANKSLIAIIGALIIIMMGLIFSGILKIGLLMREYRVGENLIKEHNRFTSFLSGIVFAAGWSPCAGPILGSVLTFVALHSTNILKGALLMSVFSLGILTPFLLISLFTDRLLPKIKQIYKYMPHIQKAGGILLVIGGLILIYTEFPFIKSRLLTSGYSYQRDTLVSQYKDSRPTMFFIFSKHCPECKKLHTILPDIKNDCKKMNITIKEIYVEDEPEIKERYRINTFPTIILLDVNGKEVKRVFGYQDIISLRVAAASIINEKCAGENPDIEKVQSSDIACKNEGRSCETQSFQ